MYELYKKDTSQHLACTYFYSEVCVFVKMIQVTKMCESVKGKRNAALVVSRWKNRIFSYLIPHVIRPKIFDPIVLVDELRG